MPGWRGLDLLRSWPCAGILGVWLIFGWRTPSDVVVQDECYGFGRVFWQGMAGADGGSGGCGGVDRFGLAGFRLAGFALVRSGSGLGGGGMAVLRSGAGWAVGAPGGAA